MKKKLLLSFAVFATAVSVNAQKKFVENEPMKATKIDSKFETKKVVNKSTAVEDVSYYFDANSARITNELNTFLGKTGMADGGFDTLALYSYKSKEKKNSTATYWQSLLQGIGTSESLTLNEITFVGSALKSSSNLVVNVWDKTLENLLGSTTLNVTNTYGYKTATFANPVTFNDTVLVEFAMATVADSFQMAYSHSLWNNYNFGTTAAPKVFKSALPYVGDAAILAVEPDYASILGLIRQNFDFMVYPSFSYNLTSDFVSSDADGTICSGESITYTNNGPTSHLMNPVLNALVWDDAANATGLAYTNYKADANATVTYSDKMEETLTYATAGQVSTVANVMMWPWTSADLVEDGKTFAVQVDNCAGINEVSANFSVFPNPANDVVNVSMATPASVKLLAADGKVIATKEGSNVSFSVNGLTAGVYFIQVENNTQKFMVK